MERETQKMKLANQNLEQLCNNKEWDGVELESLGKEDPAFLPSCVK